MSAPSGFDGLPVDEDGDWDPTRAWRTQAAGMPPTGAEPAADPRLEAVQEALRAQAWDEAASLAAAILDEEPEHAAALQGAGLAALGKGEPARAAELLERSLAADGRHADWHHNLAVARLGCGRPRAAEASLRTALRLDPGRVASHAALGWLLLDTGRLADATEALEQAVELSAGPEHLPALLDAAVRAGQPDRAERAATAARRRWPDDGLVQRAAASLLLALGAAGEAAELIAAARHRPPPAGPEGDTEALGWLRLAAAAEEAAGRVPTALDLAVQAVVRSPDDADALAARSRLFGRLGRPVEAARDARHAVAAGLTRPDLHAAFGRLALKHGMSEPAIAHLEAAVALSAGAEPFLLALLEGLTRSGRLDDAAALCLRWRSDRPWHPEAAFRAAALTGTAVPERMPDAAVVWRHDRLEEPVDERPAPAAVLDMAGRAARFAADRLGRPPRALDLGAGRGRAGAAIRSAVAHLTGIDLSARFAGWCRRGGSYDLLLTGEAAGYATERRAAFDLIVAEGLLPFFGPADGLLGPAGRALVPGGLLFLTFEPLEPTESRPWRLRPEGRYAHEPAALFAALAECGLTLLGEERFETTDGPVIAVLASAPA